MRFWLPKQYSDDYVRAYGNSCGTRTLFVSQQFLSSLSIKIAYYQAVVNVSVTLDSMQSEKYRLDITHRLSSLVRLENIPNGTSLMAFEDKSLKDR